MLRFANISLSNDSDIFEQNLLMNADFNSGQNKLNENYKMQASKLKTHLDLIGWGQEAKSVNQLLLSKQALPNKSIGAFQKSYFI